MGKLINRIPGWCPLISSLPGSALRTHVESFGQPGDVNKRSQSILYLEAQYRYTTNKNTVNFNSAPVVLEENVAFT